VTFLFLIAYRFCFRPGKWLDAMKLAASKKQESTVQSLRRVVLNGTLQAIEKGSYELETEEDPVKKLGCNMPLLKINKVSLPLDLNVVSASIAGAVLYPSTHVWPKSRTRKNKKKSCFRPIGAF
jgi:hypothetical protein